MKNILLKSVILSVILLLGANSVWAARTFKSGQKIYFKDAKDPNLGNSTWKVSNDNGNIYAYFWNDSENGWSTYGNCVSGSWNSENAIYEFTVPGTDKTYTKMLFTRGTAAKWDNTWNQTGDQTPDEGKNLFYVTSGTWGAYAKNGAIVGTMNNWNPDTNPLSSNKVTISLNYTSATSYDFKVLYGETYYGTTNAISETVSNQVFSTSGNNCTLNLVVASAAKNYTFTWDNTNKKLSVTYPTSYTVTYSQTPAEAANAPTTNPSVTSSKKVASGTSVTFTAKNANTGYTLKGWYDNNAGTGSALSSNQSYTRSITANTTVYACYDLESYTITYNLNGGSGTMTPTSYNIETETFTLPTPSKTGYTFSGWYTKSDFSDAKVTQIAKGSTGDKNFYAKWTAHKYKVIFKVNGGSGTMKEQSFTYDVEQALTKNEFTRNGYTFAGWNENASGNSTSYTDQQVVKNLTPTKDGQKTLYAQWTPNTYTVHFDGNGSTSGSMEAQEFTYDQEQTLSKNNFSKEGCIFTGWNTAADGSGTSYTNQQRVSNLATEGTITLYARWSTSNCKWLETDIANIESGDEVVITMTTASGVTYALPSEKFTSGAPKATSVNVDGKSLELIRPQIVWIIYKNGDNLTFESNYNQGNYLAFTNSDTGVRVNNDNTNRNFVVDDASGYLMNTQTDDARYLGVHITNFTWYSYKTYSVNTGGQTLKLYKKVCLDENNYWVTWDADGGLFEDGKNTKIEHYQVGTEVTPPTPTHIGYNLTGWSPILEATMPAQNMTYTAQWELKTTTITLAHQGGTDGTESITATYSQPMPSITVPTRTGYNFQGYFSSNGGTGTKYYKADGTSANTWDQEAETFTLIAYWTAKTTTVSFDPNGGDGGQTSAVTATYDQAMPAVAIPTRVGHTFLGYFDAASEGTKYYNADGSSAKKWDKEVAEISLYAQWQVNQYTVTWNANEGNWHGQTENKEVTYDYGATISEPEDPVRGGWVFNGWDPIPVATMPAQDITYTAQWGKAYCENKYTFHTGTSGVWNNPDTQDCFERKEGTETEWQIVDYVIPTGNDHTHFLVAYSGWPQRDQGSLGGHSKSVTSTWSETMYLAPAMNFESAANTPKVGHAAGAKGTLRIFDDSSWDNLCVGFIPDGYGITITGETVNASHAFHKTTTVNKWETDVIKLPGVTNHKYAMGLATEEEGTYVTCDHSKAAENIQKMGVTDKVVYLVVNDNWKADNARFAVCFMNSDKSEQTWVDMNKIQLQYAKDLYVATVPADQKYVIFCRMNGTSVENNWDNRWTQTSDIELPTNGLAIVCTISNWTEFTTTGATPQTQQNGKFRMWDNSDNKNWYVHFIPYYLLSYDKNGGEGEMAPTEYNTEDANNKVTVAANEFTRTGYDFVAWNTKADGTGTTYNPSDLFTITADATIYAIWKAQDYQITYKDQGNEDYSGSNEAKLPKTHTYDKATELVNGEKIGYTFEGWYDNLDCTGDAITKLGAKGYTADITLYAKWTFAMEYTITNTETIFITSAVEQNIKATQPLILKISNMPVGTTIDLSAGEHIHFYYANEEIKKLTNKYVDETFELEIVYKPEVPNTKEQPSITLNVLDHEKVIADLISCRSLPTTFAIVAKVGSMWYALPSQGLNSTTPPAAYPVEVDNMADPTAVTAAPENADWSLRQVYEASRVDATKDRFVANGENFVFVNNEGTPKALNASASGNYLLTDAQYSGYYETNPGLYEWTPTTTDLETYQLTNEQRSRTLSVNTATVFGVHATDKAVEQVRFLPIQNRYTPAALQVVEWKENSVVIMYNGDPAQTASVSVNGAAAQNTTLSAPEPQRDIAVYELTADGLAANPTQQLSITIGTEKTILSIPYIISGSKNDIDVLPGSTVAARQEVAKVSDLVILKDATLTADGAKSNPYKFRNVTIYGGGKLVIPSEKGFGVNSLTLRAGGITDAGEYDYVYPQFELRGTFTNSAAKINYDYITDYDHWFHLVLPFAGDLGTIKYPTEFYGANVKPDNTGSWQIKRYAGEIRATGNYDAWVDIETEGKTSTTAGQGYIFWGAPKKVSVNGGTNVRQKWGIQRITMSVTADDAETEKADKILTGLSSHKDVPNNSGAVNDQGWNLVGNPYMVNLTTMSEVGLKAGKLVEEIVDGNWTGKWINNGDGIRYLTIPSNHFDTYEAKTVSAAITANNLVPGRAFFVQLEGEANGVTFAAANRASLMPQHLAAQNKEVAVETGIVLGNETMQDEMNFWIKDGKTNDYEYNADYPKTPNNTNFNIYGVHINGNLSWVATGPEYAEESMPIGYQVPAAGTYTLSISETYYSDLLDALYVTDHAMSPEVTVDLMSAPYEFSVNQAETNNERFTISLILKSENQGPTTGWENIDVGKDQSIKFIYLDQLYILRNGIIYDATGQQIKTINK